MLLSSARQSTNNPCWPIEASLCISLLIFNFPCKRTCCARKKFGEVRGPVSSFIFNLEVGWLTLSSFLKVSAAYMFWVGIWIQNQYWVQLMKNGLRGNLNKDFIKIIETGENSDDETRGPVGCCRLTKLPGTLYLFPCGFIMPRPAFLPLSEFRCVL